MNLEKNKSYYYLSEIILYNHYYSFGMPMEGRKSGNQDYRFSFQEQEKDDEIKGQGNSLNYEYRMHDLVKLPSGRGSILAKVTGHYNSNIPFTKTKVRDHVKALTFVEQYEYGTNALKNFNWHE